MHRNTNSSSTNTYLTKMNSILNVKLHHLNNINTRETNEINRLKRRISRDEDIIDVLNTKKKSSAAASKSTIPHVEFMKQLKRGDASTSTTKIKIRHNILNAVEEALAGG